MDVELGLDAGTPPNKDGGLMAARFIPVAAPMLVGNEKAYVMDCLDSSWISSAGQYVGRFESAFADFCGVKHAIACCNGTAALHVALSALGIGPGDEVILPTLTFVATGNAVVQCGARPILVDSEAETWNIDPALIEAKITPRTKGIVVVHLYGHPVDMTSIAAIARRHGLFVVEDAAEAHGAEYQAQRVGSIGDLGIFSFFGNKIITTGEGGMVTTNDDVLASKVRQLKGQGIDPQRRYWYPVIGYNYRMTNVAAAIGLAQLEKSQWHMDRRLEVVSWYRELLADLPWLTWQQQQSWAKHAYWMFSVILGDDLLINRDELIRQLMDQGVETRPVFYPIHLLPPYLRLGGTGEYPIAERIAERGLSLPTWGGLSYDDVKYVCASLSKCVAAKPAPGQS
jgi:perosamine synthetase